MVSSIKRSSYATHIMTYSYFRITIVYLYCYQHNLLIVGPGVVGSGVVAFAVAGFAVVVFAKY